MSTMTGLSKNSTKIHNEKKKNNIKKNLFIFSFAIIPLIFLVTFTYVPLANMFYYSITSWDGLSKTKNIVGFKNYITVLTRPEYFKVFFTSLYYLAGSFVQMALALLFATILTTKMKCSNFFKGVLFFPYLLNGVAISFVFLYFYKVGGTLDTVLSAIGLGGCIQKWLGNVKINNISLACTSAWRYMGFNLIVFIGAIQSISGEIYEAAELDGANRWQEFKYIILPSIKRIIQLNLLLAINGALAVFDIPYIMTGGANGTNTFVIQTIDTAFKYNKVGLAAAMGVILFIIAILVALAQKLFFKEEEDFVR